MTRFTRWAALTAAAALLTAGCSGGGPSKDDAGEDDKASGAVAIDWGHCEATEDGPAPGDEWRCATLEVPLDWSKPDGETIDLALIRAEATGDDRIGSLLFNFGGPGGSGVSTLPAYADTAADLRERYDLVSWDPRGTGTSGGVRCRDDKAIEAAESSVDWTPDTPAEERVFLEDAADFGKGCQKAAGKLMAHVSTTDTARDMDRIRQALGDDRMNYFGISYGTELGGVYAHLFPEKVGRMTLDAVVDPTATRSATPRTRPAASRPPSTTTSGPPDATPSRARGRSRTCWTGSTPNRCRRPPPAAS